MEITWQMRKSDLKPQENNLSAWSQGDGGVGTTLCQHPRPLGTLI